MGSSERLAIAEIFRSIQGESTFAGLPCTFVRLAGCPLHCKWCDSEYARIPKQRLTVEEVLERVKHLGTDLVEITGGEPLAQPLSVKLMQNLIDVGATVLLETSGAFSITVVPKQVRIILDVKCPSSGEAHSNLWENLDLLETKDEVKFVVANLQDFCFALQVVRNFDLLNRVGAVLFSPVWGELLPEQLASWILDSGLPLRLQLQIHKVIWGDRQGV